MLNDYKKKFILSNMAFAGIILVLMLSSIFIYFYSKNILDLTITMARLTNQFRQSEKPTPSGAPRNRHRSAKPWFSLPTAKPHIISVFLYDADSGEISFLSETQILEKDALKPVIEKIIASSDQFGKLSGDHLYFFKVREAHAFKISVTDTGFIRTYAMEMLFIMLLIFFPAMFFFYLISRYLANLAVHPLETSLKLEKQFIADTSHDLKTPLTIILANTSILRHNQDACVSEMMQWIERTETAARSMQSLIEEMLVLSHIESAEHKIELETVNISEMTERITLMIEPIAYEKKVGFQTAVTEHIYVQANEEYLKRVFLSLIENAIKYEPDGGAITVSLSLQQNKAVFVVNNRLAVISQEDLPYIFERFYRSDKSRHGSRGHGLGLAIAKRILDVMHGNIEVNSSRETGTTFQVTLKAKKPEHR